MAETKGYRGMAMEGAIARWYARTRGSVSQLADWSRQARQVTQELSEGADVLEVAPGPGYFSIEMARLGRVHVTGLDISHTFVEIARANAQRAGVPVTFSEGDASRMPFPEGSFDLVVCQAAFKNFSRPQAAVDEMYRVLRPGGVARIQDMRHDATNAAIREEVRGMGIGGVRAFMTRGALRSLRRRAYSVEQFQQFGEKSPFKGCTVTTAPIGLDVTLRKPK
jgi:ubiquinone/menaquinone biosynthesis C-methylase UbiE